MTELRVCSKNPEHLLGALCLWASTEWKAPTLAKNQLQNHPHGHMRQKCFNFCLSGEDRPLCWGGQLCWLGTSQCLLHSVEMRWDLSPGTRFLGAMQPTTTTSRPEVHFYNILLHGAENCDCSPKSEQQHLLYGKSENTANSLIY